MNRNVQQLRKKQTNSEKQLLKLIKKRLPDISEREQSDVLSDLKKFVLVTHRIVTEPQAQIKYKTKKIKGKPVKHKIITTDLEEFKKIMDKPKMPLKKAFKKFSKTLEKNAKRK